MSQEDQIRADLKDIGRTMGQTLPAGYGFVVLIMGTAQKDNNMLYIANVKREDVLQMMREFIAVNREERAWTRENVDPEMREEFEQWFAGQLERTGYPEAEEVDLEAWARDAFIGGRASA